MGCYPMRLSNELLFLSMKPWLSQFSKIFTEIGLIKYALLKEIPVENQADRLHGKHKTLFTKSMPGIIYGYSSFWLDTCILIVYLKYVN